MALEDYIRDQERKAKSKTEDARSSAKDAWDDETKKPGKDMTDDVRDPLNG